MEDNSLWHRVRLGDIVKIEHGWSFKGEFFREELTGRPIVVNIGNYDYSGGFRFDSTRVREYRSDYPAEYELEPGDILLAMTCQTSGGEILGIPGRIPDDGKIYLHNQRLGKVVVHKPESVDNGFLYWLFLWDRFNHELFVTASGTKILHTAPSRIEAFEFDLPPLSEQRTIAHILGTLDDKIELNRQMNQALEEMARALFQSWFVDFDPVHAKARGEQPPGLDPSIAELFPDRFVETESGLVPEGWRVVEVSELIELRRDSINPQNYPNEEFDYYSIPAFDSRQPVIETGQSIKSNKYLIDPDAVLLSKLNPQFPRVWLPSLTPHRRSLCSTEFFVCLPQRGFSREFIYAMFASDYFLTNFAQLVTGTSGSHQRVDHHSFLSMRIVDPPLILSNSFARLSAPFFEQIKCNLMESSTLAELRDTLLPKLMSGELRVPEAGEMVESIP